LIIVNYVN